MPLRVGDEAPHFEIEGIDGRTGDRATYRLAGARESHLVLAFYPADRSPVCTRQLLSYTEGFESLDRAGLAVWAISPQDPDSHRRFADANGGFAFPLLSDLDREVGRRYGILGMLDLYRRSIVIVDPAGRVSHVHRAFGPGFSYETVPDLIRAAGRAQT